MACSGSGSEVEGCCCGGAGCGAESGGLGRDGEDGGWVGGDGDQGEGCSGVNGEGGGAVES